MLKKAVGNLRESEGKMATATLAASKKNLEFEVQSGELTHDEAMGIRAAQYTACYQGGGAIETPE